MTLHLFLQQLVSQPSNRLRNGLFEDNEKCCFRGGISYFSLSGNCKFVLEPCRGHNSKSTGHHGICCGLFWILYQKYHKWPSYNLKQVWHLKDFKTFSVITEEKSLQRMLSRHFIVQLQLLPTRWESCLIVSLIWIVVLKSAIDRVMIIQTSMLSYSLGSVVNLYFGVSVWADDRRINLHMPRGFNLLCYTAEGFSLAHCRLIPRINCFGTALSRHVPLKFPLGNPQNGYRTPTSSVQLPSLTSLFWETHRLPHLS